MLIIVIGDTGVGKSTIVYSIRQQLPGLQLLSNDVVRRSLKNLDFSLQGKLLIAREVRRIHKSNPSSVFIGEFVPSTPEVIETLSPDYIIYVERNSYSTYQTIEEVISIPKSYDLKIEFNTPRHYIFKKVKKAIMNYIRAKNNT